MKNLILITFITLSSLIVTAANKALPKPITISGSVSDVCIKEFSDTMFIYFHNQYNDQLWREGRIIPAKIINNRFSVTIQPEGEIAYFQIRDARTTSNRINSLKKDGFLINSGDDIRIDFKSLDDVTFTGQGAEKLIYQNFAGKLAKDWGTTWQLHKEKNQAQIDYWKELSDQHLKTMLDSLNAIKNSCSDLGFKLLQLNTAAAVNTTYINRLTSLLIHRDFPAIDNSYTLMVFNELNTIDVRQRNTVIGDRNLLDYSSEYISYMGDFIFTLNRINNKSNIPNFTQIFNKVTSEYSGILKDRILTYLIIECDPWTNSRKFIAKALVVIQDVRSRKRLTTMMQVNRAGSNAYDFSFENVEGKRIKLTQLRGKVVVLEAWFNGCSGCTGLAARMHPIIEMYKANKSIVFISLCVDRTRQRFLDGVKSGRYGSPYSMYLYTNGLGWEHPLCLQYQWSGYPQMLLIDKNGKIITTLKIDPDSEEKKAELIRIIEQHI